MDFFGIGLFEILLIILIALIVLGPQDMVKTGRDFGRAVRRFFRSEELRTLLQASKEIRSIPEKMLEESGLDHPEEFLPSEQEIRKEAGLDELERDMSQWKADLSAWGNSPVIIPTPQGESQAPNPPAGSGGSAPSGAGSGSALPSNSPAGAAAQASTQPATPAKNAEPSIAPAASPVPEQEQK